ncbi:MAG TPA: hypothetical protein VGJ28_05530 [Micromonosporaceae bacterium]|jgi:hypothetical protein
MPTWATLSGFERDLKGLTGAQKRAFRIAVGHFVADLRAGSFRKGLRVATMHGRDPVWEMTWALDGRATFMYGPEQRDGEPHIIWRRIGTHEIYDRP